MRINIILACIIYSVCDSTAQQKGEEFVKGVYGNPFAIIQKGNSFKDYGINAVFARGSLLTKENIAKARSEQVKIFVEFPVLNGMEYLKKHPEAWPMDQEGKRAVQADWFMGICPTDPDFIKYRQNQLMSLLGRFEIDGIWLDYLHWHAQFESSEPILPETCFCDRCIFQFEQKHAIKVKGESATDKAQWILSKEEQKWRNWRVQVIVDWVTDLKAILKRAQPNALMGIYYAPWYPDDFDGAIINILGLDIPQLSQIADVMSPMLYHERMGRSTAWVGEYVSWYGENIVKKKGSARLWPIVQAHEVSAKEYEEVTLLGSKTPSTGIMMFTINSILGSQDHLDVMKSMYISTLK